MRSKGNAEGLVTENGRRAALAFCPQGQREGMNCKALTCWISMQEDETPRPKHQTTEVEDAPNSSRASWRGLVSSLCGLGRRLMARGSIRLGRLPTRWLAIDVSF